MSDAPYQKVFNGDNIELLKQYPDNYFDSIVTDPPYGLGKEPNAEQMLQAWLTNGYLEISGSGFMGKEWDAFVPQPLFWKEAFRVLKHGGHVVSFFGTRTYDWGVMAMRLAGFEVRDCIQWIYGSGFPKSHNIGKAVDKIQGNEREFVGITKANGMKAITKSRVEQGYRKNLTIANSRAERELDRGNSQWEGWGSALKPANEPIVLARKPLEKGLSIAENVLKWGTGGINIDGCRVKINEEIKASSMPKIVGSNNFCSREPNADRLSYEQNSQGRFPANLILTHHPDCVCYGLKKIKSQIDKPTNRTEKGNSWNEKNCGLRSDLPKNSGGYGDENGEETIEDWNCHEDCPIRIMDEQSGDRKGWASQNHNNFSPYGGNSFNSSETNRAGFHQGYNDNGGASRFFYCAKTSKNERNFGLEGFEEKQTIGGGGTYNEEAGKKYGSIKAISKNFHPTVKPVDLIRYLVRLITPPNGIVLDPFNGSGTTGIACKLEGMNYVGIELDADYCLISNNRIENFVLEYDVLPKVKNDLEKNHSQLNLFDETMFE